MKTPLEILAGNALAESAAKNGGADIFAARRERPHYGFIGCEAAGERFSLFNANDCPTCLSILHRGAATDETVSIRIWRDIAAASTTIMDVGSHIGLYSLIAAATNPMARVYACEASPLVFARLCVNVLANRASAIKPVFGAVSSSNGRAKIFVKLIADYLSTAGTLETARADSGYSSIEVATHTVDRIIYDEGIRKLDLIKIDVEDHELQVLEGFSSIDRHMPFVFLEILKREMFDPIFDLMTPRGYTFYAIEDGQGAAGGVTEVVQFPSARGGRNFVLCPSGRRLSKDGRVS